MNNNKISLGTVKLGVPNYGFSSGRDNKVFDAKEFLNQVEILGINRFDTSPRYGNSEKVLGEFFSQTSTKRQVSSKIDNLSAEGSNTIKMMIRSVKASLKNLHQDKLDICYLHQNEISIISNHDVHNGLRLLKEMELISYTGASVYSFEECEYAIKSGIFDYIQVPINVFDISFYDSFIKDNRYPVRFVARSLLLQGILVNRNQITDRIINGKKILTYLAKLDKLALENNVSTLFMALAFVYSLKNIDHYLIGTTSIGNLKMNCKALMKKLPVEVLKGIYELSSQPKSWSNPRTWN